MCGDRTLLQVNKDPPLFFSVEEGGEARPLLQKQGSSQSMLSNLPLDPLLQIAGSLDGRSLAAFCECTSSDIKRHTEPHLGAFWTDLLRALPGDTAEGARGSVKADFVHAWAESQNRCPRCGRQGPQVSPLQDGYAQTQRHLCDWFELSESSAGRARLCFDSPAALATEESMVVAPTSTLQQQTLARWFHPVPRPPA